VSESRRWRWLTPELVFAIHDRQLAEHGGADGVRDRAAIDGALARPVNAAAYGAPDAADLAALYAAGLCGAHGFIDGNKRTAWVAARVFLADNGVRLAFGKAGAVRVMEDVAAGALKEAELAGWFRERIVD